MAAPLSRYAALKVLEGRALAGPFLPGYVSRAGDRRIPGARQDLGDVVVVDLDWRRVVLDVRLLPTEFPRQEISCEPIWMRVALA